MRHVLVTNLIMLRDLEQFRPQLSRDSALT